MANKNFLFGLGLGILGSNIYPLIKDNLHPIAVKMVKEALETYSSTKSFMEEINEQAMKQRQERFKRTAEDFETKDSKNSDDLSENIESLKKQLEELKTKIKEN